MGNNLEQSIYVDRLKNVYLQAQKVCQQDKSADLDMVVQALLMSYHSPLDNLNFALMRAHPYQPKD